MSDPGALHRTQDTFGKGPIALLLDRSISDGAVRQYLYMHWRYGANGKNFEGREKIADAMGVSERTVTNRSRELERANWLVVNRRYHRKTRTTRNFYHVFEDRAECETWRAEHHDEQPEPATPRKLRKGKGGKPEHKEKEGERNSGSPTNRNSGSGRDVNSGSGRDLNSGSAYLDSEYPDSEYPERVSERVLDEEQVRASDQAPSPLSSESISPDPEPVDLDLIGAWRDALPTRPLMVSYDDLSLGLQDELIEAGITVGDVREYVAEQHDPARGGQFWRDKVMSFKYVANHIIAWKNGKAQPHQPAAAAPSPLFEPLCEALGYATDSLTAARRDEVNTLAGQLLDAGATPDDMLPYKGYLEWRTRQEGWSGFGLKAMAKYWPDFLKDRADGHKPAQHPPLTLEERMFKAHLLKKMAAERKAAGEEDADPPAIDYATLQKLMKEANHA